MPITDKFHIQHINFLHKASFNINKTMSGTEQAMVMIMKFMNKPSELLIFVINENICYYKNVTLY